ncbi:hypothetical protein WG936_07600 [Corynebacterium sp. H127]|uniref:hypothetical protein n=1 Tax=Corynebacterium sp. H127 TaxID=3133418 RepID=UPI0030966E03
MAEKRRSIQSNAQIAAEVVKVLADAAANDKVKDVADRLVHAGGNAANRILAAAKTRDPFDDLEAKLDAMAELVHSEQGQRLPLKDRETVLQECETFKRGIQISRSLHGREQRQKLGMLRKQINARFDAVFELAILNSPRIKG